MTMTGTITAQMVIRNRPGTISRSSPIVIAIAGQDRGPGDGPMYGRAADHGLADGHVGATVSHVLHGLDQRRLQQEGRDHGHQETEQNPDGAGQREERRQ